MAQISKIYLDDSAGSGEFSVTPPGDRHKSRTSITVFDLKDMVDQGHGNIIVNYKKPAVFGIVNPPALHATR